MPQDMSDGDWLEVYSHLLQRLSGDQFAEVRREIETAASDPVVDRLKRRDKAGPAVLRKNESGLRTLRPRAPHEAVAAAVEVLRSRLVELPAVADAIAANLGRAPEAIEFRVDYSEEYAPGRSEPIPLTRLVIELRERTEVATLLDLVCEARGRFVRTRSE